jgi:hypothetical protein
MVVAKNLTHIPFGLTVKWRIWKGGLQVSEEAGKPRT